jgi:hypothetical protein
MDDLRVPFAERLSARQWVLVDVAVAVLAAVAWLSAIVVSLASRPGPPARSGSDIVRFLAVDAAIASITFRRRFPVAALAVGGASVALYTALAGPRGGRRSMYLSRASWWIFRRLPILNDSI